VYFVAKEFYYDLFNTPSACGGEFHLTILKRPIKKMTERSDFHKSSIFNSPPSADQG
jgi:hypothetical protein